MELRRLGGTGVEVSALCLGAMMFGAGGNPDHDDAVAIIHAALEAAVNFIDTADDRLTSAGRRSLPPAAGWAVGAVLCAAYITTLEPAEVIEDPAMMLVFLCAIMALVNVGRWVDGRRGHLEHADPAAATLADAWVLCRSTIEHPGSCDPARI